MTRRDRAQPMFVRSTSFASEALPIGTVVHQGDRLDAGHATPLRPSSLSAQQFSSGRVLRVTETAAILGASTQAVFVAAQQEEA